MILLTYVRIAIRNLFKNGRRSAVTLSAIAFGFAALALFNGYTSDVFVKLGYSAVIQEGLGHITVFKRGWLEEGTLHPEKFMLSKADLDTIASTAKSVGGVRLVSPKLNVAGLFSNGKVSTIFLGEGTIPEDYNTLIRSEGSIVRGDLDPAKNSAIQVSEGLAKMLDLHEGNSAMLSAVTFSGSMNAVNVEVLRTYNTGIPETNDKYVRLPLKLAQELVDTEGADRVMILLDTYQRTNEVRTALEQKFKAAGLDVVVKTWEERSAFYEGTKGLLSMILSFMGIIVLVIVIMSVANTMGIAVLERTREIGTLRVLGMQRRSAVLLFAIEGAALGLLGSATGVAIHTAAWFAIGAAKFKYVPPGNSEEVLFAVLYSPSFIAVMTVAMVLFALASAVLPARRAANQNVVSSLGFV